MCMQHIIEWKAASNGNFHIFLFLLASNFESFVRKSFFSFWIFLSNLNNFMEGIFDKNQISNYDDEQH